MLSKFVLKKDKTYSLGRVHIVNTKQMLASNIFIIKEEDSKDYFPLCEIRSENNKKNYFLKAK